MAIERVKNLVIIGAGLMGHNVAQIALMTGYRVVLVDIKQEFVDKGVAMITEGLQKLEAKGQLGTSITAATLLTRLNSSLDLATAVKEADFILEAVVEDMRIKKQVFKTCDDHAPSHCILATNTSTMSITEIATATNRPEKVCGMHFFNPPILMRLVEIIAGVKTSQDTMDVGVQLGESFTCLRGKRYVPRVLKDRPGFIVNRLNAPNQIYLNFLFDQAATQGVPWEQLDGDAGTLMPMGPCELSDYIGIDTMFHSMNYYTETLSPDFRPGKVISQMMQEGHLGRKTGHGFFDWTQGRPKIDKSRKAGFFDVETSMAIMLNEGCRILEEGVASGWKIIDEANMAGMNTPGPFGPGKKEYAKWVNLLESLAKKTGKTYFQPCALMRSGGFLTMRI
jgi:enoyl-CoA hydratase/3-hydroxyacyl-CoA dehydrogenase